MLLSSYFLISNFLTFFKTNTDMKKETWKFIIQILLSILTAIGTTLGVTSSCMA